MRHAMNGMTLIFLMVLAAPAAAESYKCTDAKGKVTYTNTVCLPGETATKVEDNVSVLDASAQRALIAKELEKANAQSAPDGDGGNEAADEEVPGRLRAADLAKLKEAQDLGETAIMVRQQLVLAAAIFCGVAAVFLLLLRLRKSPDRRGASAPDRR